MEKNVKKDVFTNTVFKQIFFKIQAHFIHIDPNPHLIADLDPDPATQINADPYGSGSGS
jgi:hypothetical protein